MTRLSEALSLRSIVKGAVFASFLTGVLVSSAAAKENSGQHDLNSLSALPLVSDSATDVSSFSFGQNLFWQEHSTRGLFSDLEKQTSSVCENIGVSQIAEWEKQNGLVDDQGQEKGFVFVGYLNKGDKDISVRYFHKADDFPKDFSRPSDDKFGILFGGGEEVAGLVMKDIQDYQGIFGVIPSLDDFESSFLIAGNSILNQFPHTGVKNFTDLTCDVSSDGQKNALPVVKYFGKDSGTYVAKNPDGQWSVKMGDCPEVPLLDAKLRYPKSGDEFVGVVKKNFDSEKSVYLGEGAPMVTGKLSDGTLIDGVLRCDNQQKTYYWELKEPYYQEDALTKMGDSLFYNRVPAPDIAWSDEQINDWIRNHCKVGHILILNRGGGLTESEDSVYSTGEYRICPSNVVLYATQEKDQSALKEYTLQGTLGLGVPVEAQLMDGRTYIQLEDQNGAAGRIAKRDFVACKDPRGLTRLMSVIPDIPINRQCDIFNEYGAISYQKAAEIAYAAVPCEQKFSKQEDFLIYSICTINQGIRNTDIVRQSPAAQEVVNFIGSDGILKIGYNALKLALLTFSSTLFALLFGKRSWLPIFALNTAVGFISDVLFFGINFPFTALSFATIKITNFGVNIALAILVPLMLSFRNLFKRK